MKLSSKIAIVMALLVIVSGSIPAGMLYLRYYDRLVEAELADITLEASTKRAATVQIAEELLRDTVLISRMPAVKALVQAIANGGKHSDIGGTPEQISVHVSSILKELLRTKDSYMAASFVSADNFKLMAQAQRQDDGAVVATPWPSLGVLTKPFDIQAELDRLQDRVSFFDVYVQQKDGKLVKPYIALADAIIAIYGENQKLAGAVIITFRLDDLLDKLVVDSGSGLSYYVLSRDLFYMRHAARQFEFDFVEGRDNARDARLDFPILDTFLASGKLEASYVLPDKNMVLTIEQISYGPVYSDRRVYLVMTSSFSNINKINRDVFNQLALIVVILLIVTFTIGVWLSQMATSPFEKLTKAVKRIDLNSRSWQRPAKLQGEAQVLAQALDDTFETLTAHTESLEASNRELAQFAYIASHDLQEPLRTITSFSELLKKRYSDKLDDKAQTSINFIVQSCERMRALVHGLLEYSRLGKDPVANTVDVGELIESVLADMGSAVEASGATIHVTDMPTLSLYEKEVRSLFQNLIGNAIKYIDAGTIPEIEISATKHDEDWKFSVSDNGLGIEPKYRERIFLIFQRLHGQGEFEGTGIGLANCVKIVELHRGRIWVEESANGGSTFSFLIREIDTHD